MKHRLSIHVLIYLFIVVPMLAQRPRYEKMSPMLRGLVSSGIDKPLHASQSSPREVCAFIRVTDEADELFCRYHVRPVCQYGTLYVAMIPISSLRGLSLERNVCRIEARPSGQILMDSVVHNINAHPAHEGLGLPQAFTGRGVVMGIMDIGFDLTHPTFYSRDTTDYRIRAFWDQLSQDTIGSPFPVGRDYRGRNELLALGHARDGLDQTHGTHTLGTASGSGYDSPYRGIAPESDICIVANAVGEDLVYIDSADVYKYTYATDALGFKYIFDYADSIGQPCVISFSEGSGQDFWGYDVLYYEMLDSLLGPGHILVSSAGNQGHVKTYFRKPVGVPSMGTFLSTGKNEMVITMKSSDDFMLRFVAYADSNDTLLVSTRQVLEQTDSVLSLVQRWDETMMAVRTVAYPSCYHPEETCYDIYIVTTKGVGSNPKLSVEVLGSEADVEVFRVNGSFVTNSLNANLNAGESYCNIHSPSSSPSVICVGATLHRSSYVNYKGEVDVVEKGVPGQRSRYSSVGPTYDGRIKPDVMAPGINIISSYSSFYLENHPTAGDINSDVAHFDFAGRTYAWNANSGTSMSSPAVGGAIALWLQAKPDMTTADVLGVISRTSRHHDPSLTYPNNYYGYGEIDVYRGLLDILGLSAIKSVSSQRTKARLSLDGQRQLHVGFDAPLATSARVAVYDLSGRQLLLHLLPAGCSQTQLSLSNLKKGVYAIQLNDADAMTGSELIRLE